MSKALVIAIDGPAAAGKSSAAKGLARRLGYKYLNTGSLYRALAWKMLEQKVNLDDASEVEQSCQSVQIAMSTEEGATRMWVDGVDVSPYLRLPEVTSASAVISSYPGVRKKLLSIQQEIGRQGGVVAEGRDIGSVVFPNSDLKFFLDAAASTRGERRFKDLVQAGVKTDRASTTKALVERDFKDSQRAISPLKRGEDAILIDSTFLNEKEVIERMFQEVTQILALKS
ncbi:MAG: (d)CMP kinase [Nitrospiria bacterium]